MESFRSVLRAATSEAHARLDRHPLMRPLTEGRVDMPAYRNLLAALYGLHEPLERTLLRIAERAPYDVEMQSRRRVALLRSDLIDLGFAPHEVDALPLAKEPLDLERPGRFLGALYVREGSTLGGRVLAARLDSLLGAGETRGRRFLAGDADTGRLWAGCCAALDRAGADGHSADMLDAALCAFASFENWLDMAADPNHEKGMEKCLQSSNFVPSRPKMSI